MRLQCDPSTQYLGISSYLLAQTHFSGNAGTKCHKTLQLSERATLYNTEKGPSPAKLTSNRLQSDSNQIEFVVEPRALGGPTRVKYAVARIVMTAKPENVAWVFCVE